MQKIFISYRDSIDKRWEFVASIDPRGVALLDFDSPRQNDYARLAASLDPAIVLHLLDETRGLDEFFHLVAEYRVKFGLSDYTQSGPSFDARMAEYKQVLAARK